MIPALEAEPSMWNPQAPVFEIINVAFYLAMFGLGLPHATLSAHTQPAAGSSQVNVDMHTPLHELFGQMEWSEWEDANLSEALVYVRGSHKLRIPDEFRSHIP